MKSKLTFPDFRTAGYRNISVCKELLDSLKDCPARNKVHILHKIFYLSGYVVEFSFKYILFSSLRLRESQNLYEYEDLAFRKRWQQHNFDKLRVLLTAKKVIISTDIPFLGNKVDNRKLDELLKAWDVQIRYSLGLSNNPVILTQQLMEELVNLTEQILNKVTTKH